MVRVSKGSSSKQDYSTPGDFIAAVIKRFGPIGFDLAAHRFNTKAPIYYAPPEHEGLDVHLGLEPCFGYDALKQNWAQAAEAAHGNALWLNPEFRRIAPWAQKCLISVPDLLPDQLLLFLVPASVGSDWFEKYVFGNAYVIFLNGRLCFDGIELYPKDCLLAVYGHEPGFEVWKWRQDKRTRVWYIPDEQEVQVG